MFGIIFILTVLFVLIGWAYAIKELLKRIKKLYLGTTVLMSFICSSNDLQKSLLKKR